MNTTSLTVTDQHHLDLPAGALFHPKMLAIGVATSRAEYQQLGRGLSRIDDASEIWSCDFCLFGLRTWGREDGLELAHAATGFTKGTCTKLAYIAERFEPEHRPDGFTRAHFRALLPFPQDWLNGWLPTIENRRLTSKGVRALAVEAFGSDPSIRPVKTMTSVRISSATFARLVQVNSTHPAALAEAIILAWLGALPEDQASALAVAAEIKKEQKNARERTRRKKEKKTKKPKEPKIVEPADVRYQLKKFQEASKPTYAERREQQIVDGAKPVPAKDRKYKSKVRIIFTECRGNSFIENNEGGVSRFCTASMATPFYKQENAEAAAAEYSADRGYPCEAFLCLACSSVRKTVWHVRGKGVTSA